MSECSFFWKVEYLSAPILMDAKKKNHFEENLFNKVINEKNIQLMRESSHNSWFTSRNILEDFSLCAHVLRVQLAYINRHTSEYRLAWPLMVSSIACHIIWSILSSVRLSYSAREGLLLSSAELWNKRI